MFHIHVFDLPSPSPRRAARWLFFLFLFHWSFSFIGLPLSWDGFFEGTGWFSEGMEAVTVA